MDNLLAAVDLGSNSFRLSIGRVAQEAGARQIYQVDRLKETVRLAAGLDTSLVLSDEAITRATEVLRLFGDRLRDFRPERVRVVATNTFRVARNADQLLSRCEAALGFPIEVVAGHEEARLIYSGVAHCLPSSQAQRLIVDIGGGSTELIIGKGYRPLQVASLHMGCVSFSQRFFPNGQITQEGMQQADIAARREIETITRRYKKTGWAEAFGSSGTAKALYAILTESGLSTQGITLAGMEALKAKLIRAGQVIPSDHPGIKLERADVLPGGLVIMAAIFRELKIEAMRTGDGALRVGVLYDLLGREDEHDTRQETVDQFIRRYHVDQSQAERVREATLALFDQCRPADVDHELVLALKWAASLHEIGLSIAHNGYARHTAYVLENAEMPGFSNDDQELLAQLALAHHGKLSRLPGKPRNDVKWRAILCLRLAALLFRRRQSMTRLPLSLAVKNSSINVSMPNGWRRANPLLEYALEAEASEWRKAGFSFEILERQA